LPKIHKSKILISQIKQSSSTYVKTNLPADLPFRGITAGINSSTSKLSEFLDILLKPFCPKIPSHVRDYVDFLHKLPGTNYEDIDDIIIVTCDIVNMYPNITIDLGLKAIKYWLNKFPELLNFRFTPEFILEGLELVLKNSNFQFNGDYFALIKGTATGTTVAPTYATLVMAFLEVQLYQNIKHTFGEAVQKYFFQNWKRFLDDCFIPWKKTFGDFNIVLNMLNNLDPNLNFTCEQSDRGLSFLNLFIYKDGNSLKSDIFYKDTDSHDYLPFNSCHPRHIKTNIPGNLARMICTIVEDPIRKAFRLQELRQWLRNGGYPRRLVNNQINKFRFKDIKYLRNKVASEKNDNLLVYIQTHNPKNPHVYNYLLNAFNSLTANKKFADIFKNTKLIKSVRQPPNLGRLLQKHNIDNNQTPNGSVKCNKSNCGTCPYLLETDTVMFDNVDTNVQTNFKLLRPFSCKSKDVIYKISCNECHAFYIGESVHVQNRMTKHRYDLRQIKNFNSGMKVHVHLHNCARSHEIPFTVVPFYQVTQGTLTARLTIEDYFCRKFNPTLNGN
jgi:hypothetical protein